MITDLVLLEPVPAPMVKNQFLHQPKPVIHGFRVVVCNFPLYFREHFMTIGETLMFRVPITDRTARINWEVVGIKRAFRNAVTAH